MICEEKAKAERSRVLDDDAPKNRMSPVMFPTAGARCSGHGCGSSWGAYTWRRLLARASISRERRREGVASDVDGEALVARAARWATAGLRRSHLSRARWRKKEESDVSPVGDDRRCRRRASCSVLWWCGEAETEANGDRGWSCGGVEKKRLPCEGKKLWLLLGFFWKNKRGSRLWTLLPRTPPLLPQPHPPPFFSYTPNFNSCTSFFLFP